jgi:hypothetical protein
MTRFKELKRIEMAIQHGNEKELNWALGYCRMRLSITTMKVHEKHWRKRISKIEAALEKKKKQIT